MISHSEHLEKDGMPAGVYPRAGLRPDSGAGITGSLDGISYKEADVTPAEAGVPFVYTKNRTRIRKLWGVLRFIPISLVVGMIWVAPAKAQLLLDQAISGAVGAGTELGSAQTAAPDRATIISTLEKQGYQGIEAVPDKPNQFTAISPATIPVIITIEPRTGRIIAAMPR